MAEQLESFDFQPPRCKHLYPWDDWLNGKPWKLVHGQDFLVKIASFQTQASIVSRRRGGHVKTQTVAGDAFIVQFFDGPNPKRSRTLTE